MWEPAMGIALSIFLTVTLFFVFYGIAFMIVMGTIKLVRKVRAEITKDEDPD